MRRGTTSREERAGRGFESGVAERGATGAERPAAWARALWLAACALLVAGATCETGGPSWPGGIGAVLGHSSEEGRLVVREVPPDGPAAAAGLEPGDEIVTIDDREVAGMSVREVVAALRGEVGSRVRLRVRRGGDEREVEVLRAPYRD